MVHEALPDIQLVDIVPPVLRGLDNAQLVTVHMAFVTAWERHGTGEELPLGREEFLNRFQFLVDEFGRRPDVERPAGGALDEALSELRRDSLPEQTEMQTRKTEAFHIRDTHWVRVPASGRCPAEFPVKAQFPGRQQTVCFKRDAARAAAQARQRRSEQIAKIDEKAVRLRPKEFPDGKCAACRYFITGQEPDDACKIVTRAEAELVCDAFQAGEKAVPLYEVPDTDWLAFANGMVKEQPYQHIVQRGFLTPEGPIVIIADTMKPKPHVFSLSKEFHILHTTSEHHWTQEEVNKLIAAGRIQEGLDLEETSTRRGIAQPPARSPDSPT